MTEAILSSPIFHDETAAREWLEARIWKDGRKCPHCGVIDESTLMQGESHRAGVYQCNACRKPFTVTVGTLYERSKIPLHKWLAATHLLMAGKKGISALEIGRMLGISKKSSWFLMHRIRESLPPKMLEPMGGEGSTVEIDETYIGGKASNRHKNQRGRGRGREVAKAPVFALVERDGSARAFHVPNVSGANLREIVRKNVAKGTTVYSDDNHTTRYSAQGFKNDSVNHRDGEYVRGDVHSNTVEGYFATLKRGIVGTYHHVSEQHLDRYLAEFSYRHSTREKLGVSDAERMEKSVQGIVGRRLTYRRTRRQQDQAENDHAEGQRR